MLVYVEGYLKTRSWDMEDGTKRFRTEVVLQDMIMLEKRGDEKDIDYAPSEHDAAAPMMDDSAAPSAPISGGIASAAIDDDNMF